MKTAGEPGNLFLQMQSDPATLEIPNAAETDWSPSKAELHKERTNELQTLWAVMRKYTDISHRFS